MLADMFFNIGNYESRKVTRTEKNGFIISTCYVYDLNCYETAIIDKNGTHPVERYDDKENLIKGHEKWVEFVKDGKKVKKIGYPELTDDEIIILKKIEG